MAELEEEREVEVELGRRIRRRRERPRGAERPHSASSSGIVDDVFTVTWSIAPSGATRNLPPTVAIVLHVQLAPREQRVTRGPPHHG